MKIQAQSHITLIIVVFFFFFFFFSSCSARFFPNTSSIPPTLNFSNKGGGAASWDDFNKLRGCHAGDKLSGISKLKGYFKKFGYCNYSSSLNLTDDFDGELESAVKTYQLNFNLNVTGELDEPTLNRLVRPRCGNPDVVNGTSTMNWGILNNNDTSNKRVHTVAHYSFFTGRPRWQASGGALTYAFLPQNQLPDNVRAVFARAFERWSEVTTLTFTQTESFQDADIKIAFFSGDHGDGEPFDGQMGTLAHAFAPPSGIFHLDGDENWVVDGDFIGVPSREISAVDLESVAVHEIGHVLGLGHSSVEDSIMYPTITSNTRKVELAQDDIQGIQELYGSNPFFDSAPPASIPLPWDERDAPRSAAGGRELLLAVAWMIILNFLLANCIY